MTAGQNDYFVLKVILFHKYLKGGVTNAKTKIHLVKRNINRFSCDDSMI